MKATFIILMAIGAFIGIIITIDVVVSSYDVARTKTIVKAKQDAEREVYESTQSYVDGKRQEALKLYREYLRADSTEQKAIRNIIAHSFATFDENLLVGYELQEFVRECKFSKE